MPETWSWLLSEFKSLIQHLPEKLSSLWLQVRKLSAGWRSPEPRLGRRGYSPKEVWETLWAKIFALCFWGFPNLILGRAEGSNFSRQCDLECCDTPMVPADANCRITEIWGLQTSAPGVKQSQGAGECGAQIYTDAHHPGGILGSSLSNPGGPWMCLSQFVLSYLSLKTLWSLPVVGQRRLWPQREIY